MNYNIAYYTPPAVVMSIVTPSNLTIDSESTAGSQREAVPSRSKSPPHALGMSLSDPAVELPHKIRERGFPQLPLHGRLGVQKAPVQHRMYVFADGTRWIRVVVEVGQSAPDTTCLSHFH